jgi:GTP cyclohydrolase I
MNTSPDGIEQDALEALSLRPRHVSEEELRVYEAYAAEILAALGLDLETPATRDTPRRFIEALFDATEGYDGDPNLLRVFETECHSGPSCRVSQIIEGPIHFFSLCEHHALPFFGHVYVGYIARENIIGLSKLTRLVRVFTKRLAVQERIGQQIADVWKCEASGRPNRGPSQRYGGASTKATQSCEPNSIQRSGRRGGEQCRGT